VPHPVLPNPGAIFKVRDSLESLRNGIKGIVN